MSVVYGPTPPNAKAPIGCPNGESNGDPLATNGSHAGLYQLSRTYHEAKFLAHGWTWLDAFVPERNITIAFEVWSETHDWRQWSCRP